jgi:hypothetical protein
VIGISQKQWDAFVGIFTHEPDSQAGPVAQCALSDAPPHALSASASSAVPKQIQIAMSDGSTQVRTGGSLAWRGNNPGNIEYGPFAIQHGAIGSSGRFAVFPDEATGGSALVSLLKTDRYQYGTLSDAIAAYAPPSENDTSAYVNAVSKALGVDAAQPMSSLTDKQLGQFAGAIKQHEGWSVGDVQQHPPPR